MPCNARLLGVTCDGHNAPPSPYPLHAGATRTSDGGLIAVQWRYIPEEGFTAATARRLNQDEVRND